MAYSGRMGMRNTSKRLPRHMRNEDLPRDVFTARTYQVELLDSARSRNTVVCMGSTSGRMFIAVMLLKEMSGEIRKPLSEGGKRSIYLVNTDEIVEHQSLLIQHPINVTVGVFTSQRGCKEWTAEKWKQEIEKSEVLVMTGALFLCLLQQSIISWNSINLLVIDDCHLTLQDHPYQTIMNTYKSICTDHQPRVLGLTSNILHGQTLNPENLGDLVSSLEKALQSTAETSTLVISERYGLRVTEKLIECEDYEDTTGLNEELYTLLEGAIDFLDECNIKPSEELDNRDPCLIPKAALIECHNVLYQLGPWCAACLADTLVSQLEKIEKQKENNALHKKFFKLGASTLRMVSTIFDNHFKQCEYSVDELLKYSTPKVSMLMNCLRNYRPETDFVIISEEPMTEDMEMDPGSDTDMSDDDLDLSDNEEKSDSKFSPKQIHVAVKKLPPEDESKTSDPFLLEEDKYLCGIVFVENQHEAFALNKFIEEVCSWDEGLCFVKSNHITGAKSSMKKEKKLYKKQEDVLRKFRMQELNLLVSTNVLEEGVDVPKCNLVVRFDAPSTYRSYSQSKGRARARDAEYIILVEEEMIDEFEAQLKVYKKIEEVLIRQCNKSSEDSALEVGDPACDTDVPPYVPSSTESHIQVTLDTAIMLVNRYCAKLPSDAFTHLTPACTVVEVERDGRTLYQALLRLPINSPIKDEIQGAVMSTKLKARQAVALKMCEILHKEGELDDHLMPVGKEMFQGDDWEEEDILEEEEDLLGEARPGTTKRKQYYCKKVASALLQNHPIAKKPCFLYVVNMTLTGAITEEQNTRGRKIYAPEDTPRGFGILTSKPIPLVPMFPVFTRSGEVTVAIGLQAEAVDLSEDELQRLMTFHKFLFSNVLRLEKDPMDYQPHDSNMGYVVVPLDHRDGVSSVEIDWEFTDKVGNSIGSSTKSRQPGEVFQFINEDFEDAVVMPSYRNIDQPQYFYVAEIRHDLNPQSPFPSPELYKTFAEYYTTKYGLTITNMDQPLLDVDHTSARLNLLIPRYMNQKGVPLPTSSAETKKARRENLQQKQILVPELCDIHVFLASLWKKAVCLPAILYRMNYLLLAEEIRKHVSKETRIGVSDLPEGFRFPRLDFGFDTSPESLKQTTPQNSTEKIESDSESQDNQDEDISTDARKENAGFEEDKRNGEASKGETGAATNNCDTENPEFNISDAETSSLGSEDGNLPDSVCNNKGKDEPVAIGGIEFDIYATDEKIKKFCDKPHPFLDPNLTFQNAASNGKGFMQEENIGRADVTEEALTCDLCAEVNKEYKGLGITDLVLTSCPKCAKLKTFETVERKPKIIELDDDAEIPVPKCPETSNTGKAYAMTNGISEHKVNSEVELGYELFTEQNGLAENKTKNGIAKASETTNLNDSSCRESDMHEAESKVSVARDSVKKLKENGEIEFEDRQQNEQIKSLELAKNQRNDTLNAAAIGKQNCDVNNIEECKQNDISTTDLLELDFRNKVNVNGIRDDSSECSNTEAVGFASKPKDDLGLEMKATNSPKEADEQTTDSETDVFTNIGKFMSEENVGDVEDEEETFDGPLISLDQDKDLTTFIGPSPCDILQALTMSNANDFFSLERLETIGDSFLKYAITVYLYCSYPGIHEGKLSYLRSKQVSNYNLYRLGKRKGLSECMISTKFEPYENWLPPGFIINENKRKGPVPKVHVSSLSKSASMIFSSRAKEANAKTENAQEINAANHNHKTEMKNFSKELEEINQISRAKDEEFARGDKPDAQHTGSPYSLQLHHCLPDKSIADCVEALIGCYLTSCDKMAALLFMSWMGLKVLPKRLKENLDASEIEYDRLPCPQSPFLSGSRNAAQVLARQLEGYNLFEEKIGYVFRDRSYLLQAFTHASYHYNTITDCYQRLEFLGDAVLDYVITRHLYEDSDKYSPGVLTDLRSALVNNNIFAALAVKWDFHKYFKAISPALFNVIEKFVARQKEKEDEIDIEDDETDEDQDKEHVELEVPKALGDIFESVAGAIYLDSGMSLDVVWGVFYKIMKPQIDKYLKNIPKSPVRELLEQEPETAKFDKPERTMDGKIRVTVNVVGKGVFTGVGRNYRIAKSAAAKKALKCIKTLEAEGLV